MEIFILNSLISLKLFHDKLKNDGEARCVICEICEIVARLAPHEGQQQFLRVCQFDIKLLCQGKQNGGKDNCVKSPIRPALAWPHGKSRLTGISRERVGGVWANEIEIKRQEMGGINRKIHKSWMYSSST